MGVGELATDRVTGWLSEYWTANAERFDDAQFASWLASQYVPIAGGWQY